MKDNLSEKELREFVKDIMASSLKEFDVLLPKNKSEWKDEAVNLRKTFVELMKNIESDDFSDGIKKIDSAIKHLENWKVKLEKFL